MLEREKMQILTHNRITSIRTTITSCKNASLRTKGETSKNLQMDGFMQIIRFLRYIQIELRIIG